MSPRYRFGPYVLDTAMRELRRDGTPVALQARVFDCLVCLITHRERAVSRDELVRAVFRRADVSDAQLGQVMVRTRRAVGDDGQAQHTVLTVPRYGFRWLAPIELESDDTPASGDAGAGPDAMPTGPASSDVPTARPVDVAPMQAAPRTGQRPRGRPRRVVLGAACLLVAAVALGGWWQRRPPPHAVPSSHAARAQIAPERHDALLVLPTRVAAGDDVAWVRLGLMDYIGDRLRRGGLPVLSSEAALAAHARGIADDPAQLQATVGRGWAVDSDVVRDGQAWTVRLAARGAGGVTHRSAGDAGDVLEAARIAVDRLAPVLGGEAPAGDEDPDLGERLQRARAAMLANELDVARRILLAAPELQQAQPRLQYQLARVDFRGGEHARGLARLDRLLDGEGAADPVFRAQVLNARGAMLVRLERLEEAEATYDAAAAHAAGYPAELGQALSGRAVVHAMNARFDLALADFGQARAELRRTGDALAVARIDANLGILEGERGRPSQALPLLASAEKAFAGMGAVNELATVLAARVNAELRLLQVDAALEASARGVALRDRMSDPAQVAEFENARASALRMAGRLDDAAAVLASRGSPPGGYAGRMDASLAEVALALDRGDDARALALADTTLREVPAGAQPAARAWLLLRREQAASRLDLPARSDIDAVVGASVPDRLRIALVRRGTGAPSAAVDADFVAALAVAERDGVPADIVEVVLAYGDWLLGEGRHGDAGALAGRVATWVPQVPALARLQARIDAHARE